jgi:predicted nuclease of predicted toxin-antitoxin system
VIRLVIDVNLTPAWVEFLANHGWPTVHWSAVGDPRAKDRTVMMWAREHEHVVFTHDLDFGTVLALTRADGPSVVQVRTHDVLPERIGPTVASTIRTHESQLHSGAIVTVDEWRGRVRILPIGSKKAPPETS